MSYNVACTKQNMLQKCECRMMRRTTIMSWRRRVGYQGCSNSLIKCKMFMPLSEIKLTIIMMMMMITIITVITKFLDETIA